MKLQSLNARMLIAVSALLILFFGITAGVLDYFFREVSINAINDRLDIQSQALLAAVEETDGMLKPVKEQLDPRLLAPNSGLYAEITASGKELWRSPSLLSNHLNIISKLRPGQERMSTHALKDGTRVLVRSAGYSWELENKRELLLVFSVAESEEPYFKQLSHFRWRLFGGFACMAVLLIVAMLWLMRGLLKPLRQIEQEIKSIEQGDRQSLSENFPRELSGVATNMNTLLRNERERLERYRNSLGNLAHSLKTPLAVIRNVLSAGGLVDAKKLDAQVTAMDDMVKYQLKRAAASAGLVAGKQSVDVNEAVNSLIEALNKVYFDKHMQCEVTSSESISIAIDKNDFMEMVGNLLDNAFKYGRSRVRVSVTRADATAKVVIDDDGPGIPVEQRDRVLLRGARLDERQIGQGIGLSVVNELVSLYGGTISIDQSPLGGAQITIQLGNGSKVI